MFGHRAHTYVTGSEPRHALFRSALDLDLWTHVEEPWSRLGFVEKGDPFRVLVAAGFGTV